ncbi:TetR/AcrR family transcriptional regulator [Kitasatospora sp. DSM 101779]|uniref:TetR/AcrR family transcriptional regulator n=1 Tax=Kitasatospora sp. DSM 101779 TaxID=2853165 RepID=UPI0021DA50DE|nr:TetR/AcrR family transcriptional regulator [Kitasatospora sp. DSM 101779]MCU7820871.1 TetR/AcrR family transcriptional regulator [Kitasatospora sp. DSM 101779]
MGRSSTAQERLLDAACDLLHGSGYSAVGVAEICARAEVKKGSFYHFFASKQALTLAAVDAHWTEQQQVWRALLGAAGQPPMERLRLLLDAQAAAQRADKAGGGSVRGCLLGNLALELSGREPQIQTRLAEIFDEQAALVQGVLVEAGATAPVAADTGTARAVVAQLEGAVLLAKLADDPSRLDGLWPAVQRLVRSD